MPLDIYFILYDLWDMTVTCTGRQLTRVMETNLKYYIGTVGRSSGGVQLTVSS